MRRAPRSWPCLLLGAALPAVGGCSDYFLDGKNDDVDLETVSESFVQSPLPAIDVLFVVDSTGSMASEQASFGDAAGGFIDGLDALDLDYQVGVTSMDLADQGALLGVPWILTPEQDDVDQALAANLLVGTASPPPSQGLDAAALALADPLGVNAGFRRSDAALHVVFVSDGDDESGDVLGDDPVAAFLGLLAAEESATGRAARASAIVGDVPDGCTGDGGTALAGERYVDTALGSGGKVESICSADFAGIATDIGAVAVDYQVRFPLQADPVDDSVIVTVSGARMSAGWVIDHGEPALVFEVAPPADATIDVVYSLSPGA